jgi:tetraacyldisaccharide-1-P 4'-kinase
MNRAHAVLLRGKAEAPVGWQGPTFRFDVVPAELQDWNGNPVADPQEAVAAAGIGWPQRFFDSLTQRGIRLTKTYPLTDHAPWPPSLIRKIERAAAGKPVIITGKDAVKLQAHKPPGVWLIASHTVRMDPAFWPWIEERAKLIG